MHKIVTAFSTAILLAFTLKLLHLFHFIKWNPIKFLKNIEMMHWSTLACWIVLTFLFFIGAYLLLSLFQLPFLKSPFIISLIIGLAIGLLLEWKLLNLPIEWASLKKLSIPLLVVLVMTMRFMAETAPYFKK